MATTKKPAAEVPAENKPKTVKIRLFKDAEKYKDDVFVGVNGRGYQIKRGEEVEVPDFVAEVLENSLNQDAATAELITRETANYNSAKSALE